MDAGRWQQVKAIFDEVADLDHVERYARLRDLCSGDASMIGHVEKLLRSHDMVRDFIEDPAFSIPDAVPTAATIAEGKHIGHFRVVREIGRGGMGTVFLAERDDGEFRQTVAIKVVSSPFMGAENIERFRRERQILARLNHPNIARLLDGGVMDDGLPYLVMEYVEGEPLIDHAEANGLSTDERLRLFLRICRAVGYAHNNLIVHRDIKPSNILIQADGQPKLLDFGLAKILDVQNDAVTATNYRALTPAYASPEQLRGASITTASDIYSLGVVLYELVTGMRPFDNGPASFEKMLDMASGPEPERPSSKLLRSAVTGDKGRGPHIPGHSIKGDIDNIVLMAMRAEPERRYSSVEQFANDIERHLDGLPIIAVESSFRYRAAKFLKRNSIAMIAASIVVLSIIGGLIATAWQANLAAKERDQARLEKEKTEKMNLFLRSILSAASPLKRGKDVKVLDLMDDAIERIEIEFLGQPALKANALITIANTYNDLGLPEKAEPLFRSALGFLSQGDAAGGIDAAAARLGLATSLVAKYELDEAEPLLKEAILIERGSGPERSENLALALFALGELKVRQGKFAEAEELLAESVSICDISPAKAADCAYYRLSQGRAKLFAKDLNGAESIFLATLGKLNEDPAKKPVNIANVKLNLGDVLLAKGDPRGALKHIEEADAVYEAELGESLNLVVSKFYLSRALFEQNDCKAALVSAKRSIDIARKLNWTENRNYVGALLTAGLCMTKTGRPSEGEPYLREAVTAAKKHLPPTDPRVGDSEKALQECLSAIASRKKA